MKFSFRIFAVVVGYAIVLAITLRVPELKPVAIVPFTETQIMEQLKDERAEANRNKAISRAIAAARMVFRANGCRDTYSDLTGRTAYEYRLPARLLAAVVYVESSCNPRAVSGSNSIGLLQVNPRVWGHKAELKDPVSNMRIGASILKQYVARYGIREGLHHYNGLGDPTDTYSNKVLAAGGISI